MQFQKNPSGQQWNAGNNNGYGGDEGQWGNNYDGYTEVRLVFRLIHLK